MPPTLTEVHHPPVDAGYVVAGKYELLHLLGRGSMGEVWVAHHRSLGEKVALKLLTRPPLPHEFESKLTIAARFLFEAQVAARLSRKTRHIVSVTDHGEENGIGYLVMELLDGETLETRLMNRGPMPPVEVCEVIRQTARALEAAHEQGVVHRDLKPANIFLGRDEEGGRLVKLLDFGIARATSARHHAIHPFVTEDGLVCGTPGYMSPEQGRALEIDARCDLWALATVAYEALTGTLPVCGGTTEEFLDNLQAGRFVGVHERDARLPPGLGPFFRCAFAGRIEERFSSAAETACAFERAINNGTTPAANGSTKGPSWPTAPAPTPCEATMIGLPRRPGTGKRRIRPAILAIIGFALVLATGAGAGTVSRMSRIVPLAMGNGAILLAQPEPTAACTRRFAEAQDSHCLAATGDARAPERAPSAAPVVPPSMPEERPGVRHVPRAVVPAASRPPRPIDRSAIL